MVYTPRLFYAAFKYLIFFLKILKLLNYKFHVTLGTIGTHLTESQQLHFFFHFCFIQSDINNWGNRFDLADLR